MATVANAVPGRGVVALLMPILTSVVYYATAENQWARIIHPHLEEWMSFTDKQAIQDLYEGIPPGSELPWELWVRPLLAWGFFFLVLYFVASIKE